MSKKGNPKKRQLRLILVSTSLVFILAAGVPATAATDHPDSQSPGCDTQSGLATALQQVTDFLLSVLELETATPETLQSSGDKTAEQAGDEPGTGADDELGGFVEPIG